MAKVGEACGGAGSLEAELTCPICLELYQEPVSLSCGHNFCRRCIEKVLGTWQNSRGPSACPTCRAHLGPTVEPQNNFNLSNIVEAFQATTSKGQQAGRKSFEQEEGAEQGEAGVVPCEHCLDGPQPALKTCLVCEASLCQAHLSKHNAKGFHQEHVLVEVGAGEERRCGDHGKLLECYCLKEEECICILCSIAGTHKGHEVITMKEGHGKQLVRSSSLPVVPALAAKMRESRRKGGGAFTGNGGGREGSSRDFLSAPARDWHIVPEFAFPSLLRVARAVRTGKRREKSGERCLGLAGPSAGQSHAVRGHRRASERLGCLTAARSSPGTAGRPHCGVPGWDCEIFLQGLENPSLHTAPPLSFGRGEGSFPFPTDARDVRPLCFCL